MDILNRILKLTHIERNVFFEELEDSGREDVFIRYAAGLTEEALKRLLEPLHPYYRNEIMQEIKRVQPVSAAELAAAEKNLMEVLDGLQSLLDKQEKVRVESIQQIRINRDFMKEWLTRPKPFSDQMMGVACPPVQRAPSEGAALVKLPEVRQETLARNDLFAAIRNRQSRRKFTARPLSLDELSFLLWSTQGIKKILANGVATIRTVPSGGARHPFETYLAVNWVDGLKPGVYHYLPVEHQLELLFEDPDLIDQMKKCGVGQRFVGECAVNFIWSCIPYRGEWRYTIAAHKVMLLDAGHLCQNLYLACEAIGCGTCAVGAYNQKTVDEYLRLDGENEFVIYMSPVGKLADSEEE